jgi:hypothetical protein
MIEDMPSPSYAPGAIFNVHEQRGIQRGWIDNPPNEQCFDVAVIQFRDDGTFVDEGQLPAAAAHIKRALSSNPNGAIVVVFIHGWHHGAAWDISTNSGDEHFNSFRQVLRALALREAERYYEAPPGGAGRRVIGVYLGWNGDPVDSWLSSDGLFKHISLWNRYKTAPHVPKPAAALERRSGGCAKRRACVSCGQAEVIV